MGRVRTRAQAKTSTRKRPADLRASKDILRFQLKPAATIARVGFVHRVGVFDQDTLFVFVQLVDQLVLDLVHLRRFPILDDFQQFDVTSGGKRARVDQVMQPFATACQGKILESLVADAHHIEEHHAQVSLLQRFVCFIAVICIRIRVASSGQRPPGFER